MDLFFSTGQAARELGVSPATFRALCAAGAIEAQVTPGGQYRISRAVVEKLKQTGLPNLPRPLPLPSGGNGAEAKKNGDSRLLGPPSEDLIASTGDLIATENLLKRRKVERELEETEDWFRKREDEEAARVAAQDEAERDRMAQEESERERGKWLQGWERYALNSLPYDAPPEVRLATLRRFSPQLLCRTGLDTGL